MTDRPAPPDSDVEITPEMIEAGEQVLKENYISLVDVDDYPEIVRAVFLAMMKSRASARS